MEDLLSNLSRNPCTCCGGCGTSGTTVLATTDPDTVPLPLAFRPNTSMLYCRPGVKWKSSASVSLSNVSRLSSVLFSGNSAITIV